MSITIELIVEEDEVRSIYAIARHGVNPIVCQVFQLVNKDSFRQLLMFMWPSLTKRDIPHQTRIHNEIHRRACNAQDKVGSALETAKGKVSSTFDTWTSATQDP